MLVQGQIDVPDWNLYARFPNLLHGVYIPLLALDATEAAPRLLTVFLGLLIAYCLYRIGGLWFSSRAGGIAGLLFLTTPMERFISEHARTLYCFGNPAGRQRRSLSMLVAIRAHLSS